MSIASILFDWEIKIMVALIASSLGLGFGKPNPYILWNPEL